MADQTHSISFKSDVEGFDTLSWRNSIHIFKGTRSLNFQFPAFATMRSSAAMNSIMAGSESLIPCP